MRLCNTYQLLEEIASNPQAITSRVGSFDSMEAIDSSRLVEGKDVIDLIEGGMWSKWVFQRQPAVPGLDVQLLDDANARFRMAAGEHP